MPNPPSPKFSELEELTRRQKALLAGMEAQAMYPEVGGSVGDFERDAQQPFLATPDLTTPHGRREALGFEPNPPDESTGDFRNATSNKYKYKPEFQGSPGADAGEHVGPMAHELEGIPGVVKPGPDGMKRVDPARLAMANASATGENSREIDMLKKRLEALGGATAGEDDDAMEAALSGRY